MSISKVLNRPDACSIRREIGCIAIIAVLNTVHRNVTSRKLDARSGRETGGGNVYETCPRHFVFVKSLGRGLTEKMQSGILRDPRRGAAASTRTVAADSSRRSRMLKSQLQRQLLLPRWVRPGRHCTNILRAPRAHMNASHIVSRLTFTPPSESRRPEKTYASVTYEYVTRISARFCSGLPFFSFFFLHASHSYAG